MSTPEVTPESYDGRTNFRNMLNRPDIGLGDSARWCGVCHCWDIGLLADEKTGQYTHPYHWIRDGDTDEITIIVDGKPFIPEGDAHAEEG